jgi:hypothetical protein
MSTYIIHVLGEERILHFIVYQRCGICYVGVPHTHFLMRNHVKSEFYIDHSSQTVHVRKQLIFLDVAHIFT